MQLKLLLPLIAGVLVVISTIFLGMSVLRPPVITCSLSDDERIILEPELVPIGEPPERTSLAKATFWAEQSGFVLKTPTETKGRHYWKILMSEPRWDSDTLDYHINSVTIIYSQERVDLDQLNFPSLLASGSFRIRIWHLTGGGPPIVHDGLNTYCLYDEQVTSLRWIDNNSRTGYDIFASPRHFSEQDILEIAQSIGLDTTSVIPG